ncbi:unnamed protein product [marine sediment metagenome]|uniref:Uncharacterized protein n=1 Tax=marine sediment metagenome TaxID=412755 RepID=X1DU74_9ZZZZ
MTTNPVTEAPATALIEVGGAEKEVAITTLDGLYETVEEFEAALEATVTDGADTDKIYNFFPMTLPDARALTEALTEALQAAKED